MEYEQSKDFETSVIVANIVGNLQIELEQKLISKDDAILIRVPSIMLTYEFSNILVEQMEMIFGENRNFIVTHKDIDFEQMTTTELLVYKEHICKILEKR